MGVVVVEMGRRYKGFRGGVLGFRRRKRCNCFDFDTIDRSLLYLRRFKEVADMLQDYIPSVMTSFDDSSSSSSSDNLHSREGVKLLSSGDLPSRGEPRCKCFSVSDLKKKVMARLGKKGESEGQWR